jgi:hypothetical protein
MTSNQKYVQSLGRRGARQRMLIFSITNNEKMNVVNQKTTRQKIKIDMKKSIRRVA